MTETSETLVRGMVELFPALVELELAIQSPQERGWYHHKRWTNISGATKCSVMPLPEVSDLKAKSEILHRLTVLSIPFVCPSSWHMWVGPFSVARKKRV